LIRSLKASRGRGFFRRSAEVAGNVTPIAADAAVKMGRIKCSDAISPAFTRRTYRRMAPGHAAKMSPRTRGRRRLNKLLNRQVISGQ
jgi:hypothetical protein